MALTLRLWRALRWPVGGLCALEGDEGGPEGVDGLFEAGEGAGVFEQEAVSGVGVVCLRGEALAGVGEEGGAFGFGERAAGGDAVEETLELEGFGSGDADDGVETGAPARGAGVRSGEDESGLDDGDGVGIALFEGSDEACLLGEHGRVDDGVELVDARVSGVEGEAREGGAVERAVAVEDARAETLDDRSEDGLAGVHERAADFVGGEDVRAVRGEQARDGGFAAAEIAGEANAEHAGYLPRRRRAALTVFDMSMAMVSAPTPPGTGV